MARTTLMRSLQQLAHDHAEASTLDRRDFLKRAGAVGAAAALGPAALAKAAGSPRVAIVGGGIAGLTAALTLADRRVAVTVYEASSRIGGRMHSDTSGYWADGQVSEWCGELIDTGHKTIRQLAHRFGLPTVDLIEADPTGSTETYFFGGHYYSAEQARLDFGPVSAALGADIKAAGYPTTYNRSTPGGVALDNMSVYDWIESRVPGGHSSPMGMLLDVAYQGEYGADATVQSALNLVYLLGYQPNPHGFAIFGLSDERFHIAGGNETLPAAIAAALPAGSVLTGRRLTRIKANSDGSSTLTFDTGGARSQTVTADHVILTLPFTALRSVDYSRANFDSLKKTAIANLGDGRNTKLQLQFANRLWNGSGPWGVSNGSSYADTGYANTWDVTRAQPGGAGILVDYAGGSIAGSFAPSTPYSNAASNPQVTAYAQAFLAQIEPVFPGISSRWTGKATLSVPALDPNLGLSYSYWKVGQYHAFSGYEGVRQGNIHFAGEHCSQDFQGFMEGGASEGARAAGEILHDLNK